MELNRLYSSPRRLKKSLSALPEAPDHVLMEFSITKEAKETWGITIVGGVKSVSGSVYIKGIDSTSVCGRDGQLKVGDSILEVNGENLMDKTHEEAVEVFRRCHSELSLVVSRLVNSTLNTDSPVLCSFQSSVQTRYIYVVT